MFIFEASAAPAPPPGRKVFRLRRVNRTYLFSGFRCSIQIVLLAQAREKKIVTIFAYVWVYSCMAMDKRFIAIFIIHCDGVYLEKKKKKKLLPSHNLTRLGEWAYARRKYKWFHIWNDIYLRHGAQHKRKFKSLPFCHWHGAFATDHK